MPEPSSGGPDLRDDALATPRWLAWIALGTLLVLTAALLLRVCAS